MAKSREIMINKSVRIIIESLNMFVKFMLICHIINVY